MLQVLNIKGSQNQFVLVLFAISIDVIVWHMLFRAVKYKELYTIPITDKQAKVFSVFWSIFAILLTLMTIWMIYLAISDPKWFSERYY